MSTDDSHEQLGAEETDDSTEKKIEGGLSHFTPLVGVVVSMVIPWITLTAPFIGNIKITGLQIDLGKVLLVAVLLTGGIVYKKPRVGRILELAVGSLGTIAMAWFIYDTMTSNPENAIVSLGMGAVIALISCLVMVYEGGWRYE